MPTPHRIQTVAMSEKGAINNNFYIRNNNFLSCCKICVRVQRVRERLHGGGQKGKLNLVKLSDRNLPRKISLPMLKGEDRKIKKK